MGKFHHQSFLAGILTATCAFAAGLFYSNPELFEKSLSHLNSTIEKKQELKKRGPEIDTSLEHLLQFQKEVPEEFYIKLFESDDFLPVSYDENCLPNQCHAWKAFSHFLDEQTDLYSFALQSINSGRRPRNRAGVVPKLHDRTVTWLDAIHTLTKLDPNTVDDQKVIRQWIAANYALFLLDEIKPIKPEHIFFTSDASGIINDIKYNGPNANINSLLPIYTEGYYSDTDSAWIATNPAFQSFPVTTDSGHLVLPVTSDSEFMLHIPDYLLRDDITTVAATVPIGNKLHHYTIPLTEIIAELVELQKRLNSGIPDPYNNQIITAPLERVVSDIVGDTQDQKQKLRSLLSYLQTVPYSHSSYNSPPLVTVVAGGMRGATSGQLGAMLELAGIQNYGFIYFKTSSGSHHVGVYIPKNPNNTLDLNAQITLQPDKTLHYLRQYWYIETTSGEKLELLDFMSQYPEAYFYRKYPTADLRQQIQQEKNKTENPQRNCIP